MASDATSSSESAPPATSSVPAAPVLPRTVHAKTEEAFYRVQHWATFLRVWERLLTENERLQLGGDAKACFREYKGAVGMWMALHPMSQPRAIIQLAHRTDQLSETDYRWLDSEISKVDPMLPEPRRAMPRPRNAEEDIDEKISRAKDSHDLVLVEGNGFYRMYWKGNRVDQQWGQHGMSWELIWQLAEKAKLGGQVSWDQFTNSEDRKTVTSRRSRLKPLLPPELDGQIASGTAPGTYKLIVARRQIALIELEPHQYLLE